MNPVMTRLARDHAHLGQMLDLLHGLLDRFHDGIQPDYELLHEMVEYMANYADLVHHRTEDIIFSRVKEKTGQAHPVFAVLMRQHEVLRDINRQFRKTIEGIMNEEVLLREDVELDGRDLVANLRAHLALEDQEAFPIVLKALDDEDWRQIGEQLPDIIDPVFSEPDKVRFRSLYRTLYQQAHTPDSEV